MIYFTSDTHFGHANIIEYCGRPFADVEEMNRTLVERWNARVRPEDTVFHLGDFAFGPVETIGKFLQLLNGEIHLVLGNHDRSLNRMQRFGFKNVSQEMELILPDTGISLFLSHRPEDAGFVVDYHLHGHVHERWVRRGNQINVGVDVRGFEPKTLQELLA